MFSPHLSVVRKIALTVVLVLSASAGWAREDLRYFPVNDFGALGDGQRDNTKAIQSAIDACTAAGGGIVLLTSGTYLSGPLYLKSNVIFDIEPPAVLQASSDHTAFGEPPDANTRSTGPSLINAVCDHWLERYRRLEGGFIRWTTRSSLFGHSLG